MIGPLFDMFTGVMFIYLFFCEIPKYLQAKNRPAHLDWDFMEVYQAGWDGECRLTRFHPIRNFLENEIYHFSRLSHQTGCLFTWAAHSK